MNSAPLSRPVVNPDDWRAFISLERLAGWMDENRLGEGPIENTVQLSGGTQNILLRFTRNGRSYVLRRPPENPYLDGNQTIRREARVLHALAGSNVPHPRMIASCADEQVIGSAFYLMEVIDGFAPVQGLPPLHAGSESIRRAMGLSVIDGLVELQKVDPIAAGLGDFGKPESFLQRQVPRWMRQLDSYRDYDGWAGREDLVGVDELAKWLEYNIPNDYQPGVIHGDFHLGNVLISRTGPDLLAIVDWELATLGDPLVDLGCLLATWTDPDGWHPGCISVTPWTGFPTEEELVAHYAARSNRDMAGLNWFVVLACFKLGILQEGTHARACAGKADADVGRWMHETSINLFKRALSRI